ncbi:MAG: hypothetical protein ABIF88_03085 [archaeon]
MERKIVWEFTNQRKLTKPEFIDYFQRKIFRTIRKYQMLPKDKIIKLKKANDLNTLVLKEVLEKKFKTEFSTKPNLSSDNLSQITEDFFKNVIKGKFEKISLKDKPTHLLSDREVELYAKLIGIKGATRKRDEKIQELFGKFMGKNQDLEINVLKAMGQL